MAGPAKDAHSGGRAAWPTRRRVLAAAPQAAAVIGLGSAAGALPPDPARAADEGKVEDLKNAGDGGNAMPPLPTRIDLAAQAGVLPGLHAVHVERGGEVVAARYFRGEDSEWGIDLGTVAFGPDTLHDLRSITKSITSLLYGIALERGEVPPLDAPLMDAFPSYAHLSTAAHQSMRISHALNMSLGLEWNEDVPYNHPDNSEIAMEMADDRWQFILTRPFVALPGEVWRYNGGATAMIGHVIERGTGIDLADYARERLLAPLGIDSFSWSRGWDGVAAAASGMRLTAPALARIGRMVLDGGVFEGRRIVPAFWIEALRTAEITTSFGIGYSRSWYITEQPLGRSGGTATTLSAMGNGGQRLFVIPSLDLVGVVYCGKYNEPDQWLNPMIVLQRLILADL